MRAKGVHKPKGGVTDARKPVGKTAQRVKTLEVPVPCPNCDSPKTVVVLYYPPSGKPVNARGCPKCQAVWAISGLSVLARGARL